MTEVDDPVRLIKKGNPLAQRPVLAVGLLCAFLLIVAIAMGRAGAAKSDERGDDVVARASLTPADNAAEEVIRGLRDRERPLYEQPLTGPDLRDPSEEYVRAALAGSHAYTESGREEEQLRKALTVSSRVEVQAPQRPEAPPPAVDSALEEDSSYLAGGHRLAEVEALQSLTAGRDQPKYAQKAKFIREGAEDWPGGYLRGARQAPLSPYELKAGAVIPAVMISGINSDLPGQILGQVSEDVYDTGTGRYLLIPQGSKVVGTYDNQVAFAQKRALVIWTKLIFPDASQLELEGMPGAGPAGSAGFKDQVNRHVARRIGAALLLTVFNLGAELTRQAGETVRGFQTQSAVTAAVGQSVAELGREMVEKESEVPNTLEVRPGYRFNVMVNKDIAFKGPYRRR